MQPELQTVQQPDGLLRVVDTHGYSNPLLAIAAQLLILGSWVSVLLLPFGLVALCWFDHAWIAGGVVAWILYGYMTPYGTSQGLKAFICSGANRFEQCTMLVEEVPDLNQPHIFCYAPHGIFSWGFILNAGLRPGLARVKGLIAWGLYYAPIFHHLMVKRTQSVTPADKANMLACLRDRQSFGLIPGGFEEASLFQYGKDRIFIKSRKGFVKYALQYGFRLVPTYTFGESHTYLNAVGLPKLRLWLNKHKIPAVVPFGVWWCPLLPRTKGVRLNTVMGKAMVLPHIPEPTKDDVDHWHQQYIDRLRALFDCHKATYGDGPDSVLEIF